MFLCSCKAITETQVRALRARGVTTVPALIEALQLDDPSCCGRCLRDIESVATSDEPRVMPLAWARSLSPGS